MFYKFDGEKWWNAQVIALPSGEILSPENKQNLDGWKWHDEPPQDYLDWLETQQNHINT
jgi:hypothetical protein